MKTNIFISLFAAMSKQITFIVINRAESMTGDSMTAFRQDVLTNRSDLANSAYLALWENYKNPENSECEKAWKYAEKVCKNAQLYIDKYGKNLQYLASVERAKGICKKVFHSAVNTEFAVSCTAKTVLKYGEKTEYKTAIKTAKKAAFSAVWAELKKTRGTRWNDSKFAYIDSEKGQYIRLSTRLADEKTAQETAKVLSIIEKLELTEAQKNALITRLQGYSVRDCAQRLNISKTAFEDRIAAARKKILSMCNNNQKTFLFMLSEFCENI